MVPRGEELISLLFDYSAPALGEQDSSGTGLCNVAPVRVGACLPDDRSPGPAVEDGQEHHALPTPRLGTIGEHDRIGTSPAPPPLAAPATRTATQRGGQMSSLWDTRTVSNHVEVFLLARPLRRGAGLVSQFRPCMGAPAGHLPRQDPTSPPRATVCAGSPLKLSTMRAARVDQTMGPAHPRRADRAAPGGAPHK